jgi:signal peptidase I
MADDNNPSPGNQPPTPPDGIAPGSPLPRPVPERPTEIILNPRAAPRPISAVAKPASDKPAEPKDSFREVVETVVFVVVLVLLLKTFLAEAFVIPTGSMATTLLGYNLEVTCPECGYSYLVNASKEADPQEPDRQHVIGCTCPNCEYQQRLK